MSELEPQNSELLIRFVSLELDRETYLIDVLMIQEVLRLSEIAPVPGAPSFVLGIINLRGNVVTVVDARTKLNLPSQEHTDDSRIVVVEVGAQVVGILVDRVLEVVEVLEQEIETKPNIGRQETSQAISGVVCRNDRIMSLLAIDKLLSSHLQAATSGDRVAAA